MNTPATAHAIQTPDLPDAEQRSIDRAVIAADLTQHTAAWLSGVNTSDKEQRVVTDLVKTYLATLPTSDEVVRYMRSVTSEYFPHETTTAKGTPNLYKSFRHWRDTFKKTGKSLAENGDNGGYTIECRRDASKGASDYIVTVSPITQDMAETAKQRATAEANREAEQAEQDKALAVEAHKAEVVRTPMSVLAQQLKASAVDTMPGVNLIELAAAFTTLVNLDLTTANK